MDLREGAEFSLEAIVEVTLAGAVEVVARYCNSSRHSVTKKQRSSNSSSSSSSSISSSCGGRRRWRKRGSSNISRKVNLSMSFGQLGTKRSWLNNPPLVSLGSQSVGLFGPKAVYLSST